MIERRYSRNLLLLISILSLKVYSGFTLYRTFTCRSWRGATNRWSESKNYFLTEPKWFNALSPMNKTSDIPDDSNTIKTRSSIIRQMPIFQYDEGVEFPTGRVPLNIFVEKYVKMMTDAYDSDKMFGIVCSNGNGKSYEIGTAVEIVHRQILDDGRHFLVNACRQRFRILKIIQEEPYMIAEVEYGLVDSDVLKAENSGAGELPSNLCDLEKEVYQTLKDIVALTNKLVNSKTIKKDIVDGNDDSSTSSTNEEENDDDVELQVSQTVQLLSPQNHPFRLQVASEFSFAISDIISGLPLYRQLLLESESLELRLLRLKQLLGNARENLLQEVSALEEPFS